MILFIIYTLLKKYKVQRWIKTYSKISKFLKVSIHTIYDSLLIRLMLLLPIVSIAQNVQLNYKIMQGRNDIGWLRIEKNSTGNKSELLLVSEIKTKVILPITLFTRESSTFENGKLIYSSQFRKTNGTTKLDKQTKLVEDKYEVLENGEKVKLAFPTVYTNLLSLYFQEPITSNSVYCDRQQCFVKITKTEDGGYKMKFPNGNSNCFYYKEGICTKIKIDHSFYSAEIILKP
ncbi:hypothetical protein SAMN05216269_105132 [Flavobacterium xinjiangense]|jgi:hypothetical protein|uniref:Uncharacterized protein n=1 Tax=Flavobacterium xinjiangense TaxID=178356 RepID=A0A1M7K0P1_9FLAO|nr:hypothetical protein SAMN05216269_105132 [Flavobacterium xinjiangense]